VKIRFFRVFLIKKRITSFTTVTRHAKEDILALIKDSADDAFVRSAAINLLTEGDVATPEVKTEIVNIAQNSEDNPRVRKAAFDLLTKEDVKDYDALEKEIDEALRQDLKDIMGIVTKKSRDSDLRIRGIGAIPPFEKIDVIPEDLDLRQQDVWGLRFAAPEVKIDLMKIIKDRHDDPFVRIAALNLFTEGDVENYSTLKREIVNDMKRDLEKLMNMITDESRDSDLRIRGINALPPFEDVAPGVKAAIVALAGDSAADPFVRNAAFDLLTKGDVEDYEALEKAIRAAIEPGLRGTLSVIMNSSLERSVRMRRIESGIPSFEAVSPSIKAGIVALARDGTDDPFVRKAAFDLLNTGDVEDYDALKKEIEEAMKPVLGRTMKIIVDKTEDGDFRSFLIKKIPPLGAVVAQVKADIVRVAEDRYRQDDPEVSKAAFDLLTAEDVGGIEAHAALGKKIEEALEEGPREAVTLDLEVVMDIIRNNSLDSDVRIRSVNKIPPFEEAAPEVKADIVTFVEDSTNDPFVRNAALKLLTKDDIKNYKAVKDEIEEAVKPDLKDERDIIQDKSRASNFRIRTIDTLPPFDEVQRSVKAAVVAVAEDATEDPFVRNAALKRLTEKDIKNYKAVKEAIEEAMKPDLKYEMSIITNSALNSDIRIDGINALPPFKEVRHSVKTGIVALAQNKKEDPFVRNAAFKRLTKKDVENYKALEKEITDEMKPGLEDEMSVITSKRWDKYIRILGIKTAIPSFEKFAPRVKAAIVEIAKDDQDEPEVRKAAFDLLAKGDVENYDALGDEINDALKPDLKDEMDIVTNTSLDSAARISRINALPLFNEVQRKVKAAIVALATDPNDNPFVRKAALNLLAEGDVEDYGVLKDEIEDAMKPDLKDVMDIVTDSSLEGDLRISSIGAIPSFDKVQLKIKAAIVDLAQDPNENPSVRMRVPLSK